MFRLLAAQLNTTPQALHAEFVALSHRETRNISISQKNGRFEIVPDPSESLWVIRVEHWPKWHKPYQVFIYEGRKKVRLASDPSTEGWSLPEIIPLVLGLLSMYPNFPFLEGHVGVYGGCVHLFHTEDCGHNHTPQHESAKSWRRKFAALRPLTKLTTD